MHQLVDHQGQRRRLPAGQGDRLAVDVDGRDALRRDHCLRRHARDPLHHVLHVDQVEALLRQHFVHRGNAADAVDIGLQHLLRAQTVRFG